MDQIRFTNIIKYTNIAKKLFCFHSKFFHSKITRSNFCHCISLDLECWEQNQDAVWRDENSCKGMQGCGTSYHITCARKLREASKEGFVAFRALDLQTFYQLANLGMVYSLVLASMSLSSLSGLWTQPFPFHMVAGPFVFAPLLPWGGFSQKRWCLATLFLPLKLVDWGKQMCDLWHTFFRKRQPFWGLQQS